jgi:PEP-CTERM motif
MSKHLLKCALASLALGLAPAAEAGPFTNPFITATAPAIDAWADGVASFGPTTTGSPPAAATNALGAANGATVSLGDLDAAQIAALTPPGQITLTFSTPITNGAGADIAVFENAFSSGGFWFAELGYLEVSSDGVNFARFPSVSLNTEADLFTNFGRDFALIDRTNVNNLVGIHQTNQGTLFDLDDLLADALVQAGLVDLGAIGFVRVVDVPGNGAFLDSLGNPILDAWPTVGSGGVDLDAIAALHIVPEPATLLLVGLGVAGLALRRRS